MAEPTKRKRWSDVKVRLETFDRKGLVSLIGDLYDASVANRRFLHSRLTRRQRRHRGVPAPSHRRDIPRPVQQSPGQRPRCSRSHRRVPALNGRCIRDRRPHADVAMLLTKCCTRSTLALPQSGPARLIDVNRDVRRGGPPRSAGLNRVRSLYTNFGQQPTPDQIDRPPTCSPTTTSMLSAFMLR